MISTILITLAAAIALFLLSSFRKHQGHAVPLATLAGVFIIHSAHKIFEGIGIGLHDYRLLVDATFMLPYIPLIALCIVDQSQVRRISMAWLFMLVLTVAAAIFLYTSFFILKTRSILNYANLIWHLEVVALALLAQKAWQAGMKKEADQSMFQRRYLALVKTWIVILLLPYVVSLISHVLPEDNFVFSYAPLLSLNALVELGTITLLAMLLVRLYRFKLAFDSTATTGNAKRSLNDITT